MPATKAKQHFAGKTLQAPPAGMNPAVFNRPVLDSNESVFFLRELEHIMTKVHDIEYAKLKARLLIPVNSEPGPGAQYTTWRQFDKVGRAKIVRDYARDLPRVDVVGSEFFNNKIVSLAASFGYTVQEIRSARYTGMPLEQRRANTAKEAILREENDLAFAGDANTPLTGFLTNTTMTQIVLPADGVGGQTAWSTKTADQILRDLNLIANSIVSLTKEIEQPDTMIMPVDQFNLLATKRIGIDSNNTVLKFFLDTNPYIQDIEPLVQLSGIGGGATDRVMAYDRSSEKVEMIVPMDVIQYEPQLENLEYIIPLESRFGGILIYKPLSLAFSDGI
jgi:hypothetical protein